MFGFFFFFFGGRGGVGGEGGGVELGFHKVLIIYDKRVDREEEKVKKVPTEITIKLIIS